MRLIPVLCLMGCGGVGPLVEGSPSTGATTGDCPGPGCVEVCDDGIDNDGDSIMDCSDPDCADSCDFDADNEGFNSIDSGGADCDDNNPDVNPNAPEVCDGVDNNCDGLADDDDPNVDPSTQQDFYRDADGDGYGVNNMTMKACEQPSGATSEGGDCDDDDASTNPGAIDVPGDCIDQDCDGYTGDEGCAPIFIGQYLVDDGDAWGNNPPVYTCMEACAIVFGGVAQDYACSTDQVVIDNQANSSTWGVGGCGVVAEDYSLDGGGGYNCGAPNCATSAYVQDNCIGAANFCFEYP